MSKEIELLEQVRNGEFDDNELIGLILHLERENQVLLEENKKYKEVIDKVSTRLEYFLIGNLKYRSSQEEFIKLLNMLKEVK